MTVPQPALSGLFMQTWPTLHDCSLAVCDFLAKDGVGKNAVATAVATTAKINFLIVFIGHPFAKAPAIFANCQNVSRQGHINIRLVLH